MNKETLEKAMELQETIRNVTKELNSIYETITPKLIDYVKKFHEKFKYFSNLNDLYISDIYFNKKDFSFKAYTPRMDYDEYEDICEGEYCYPYDMLENPDKYIQKAIDDRDAEIESAKVRAENEAKQWLIDRATFFGVPLEKINTKTGFPCE